MAIIYDDIKEIDVAMDTEFIQELREVWVGFLDKSLERSFFNDLKVMDLDRAIINAEIELRETEEGKKIAKRLWNLADRINDVIKEREGREGEEKISRKASVFWESVDIDGKKYLIRDEEMEKTSQEMPTAPMPLVSPGIDKKWMWDPEKGSWIAVKAKIQDREKLEELLQFDGDDIPIVVGQKDFGFGYRKLDDIPSRILLRELDKLYDYAEERELTPDERGVLQTLEDEAEYRQLTQFRKL